MNIKYMKKLLKIVIALVIFLAIAVIAVPFLVPLNAYKGQIINLVKEKTGRDLTIAGDIKATIFPVLGVKIGKTSLSNPKGYSSENMVQADGLTVEVGIEALLRKQLQIKQFILTKPLVNLEIGSNNKPNWIIEGLSDKTTESAEKTSEAAKDSAGALLAGLMIGDVKISEGEINYLDNKTKNSIKISALNVKASLPSLDKKFEIDGNAIWNNEKIILKAFVEKPRLLIDGKKSAFVFDINSKPVTVHYVGEASQTNLDGNIDLNIPSLPQLVNWTGGKFDWKGSTPLAFSAKGNLAGSAENIAFKNAELGLDSTKFKGSIKAAIGKKIPDIEADLSSDSLNLNPYLKKEAERSSWFISSAFATELSNQHIDLSSLNAVNAKVALTLGSVIYEKIKLGKTVISANLNNGSLKLQIPETSLYGGSAKVDSTLDSSGSFTKQFNLTNVNIGELLSDLNGGNRFAGTINASANLNGKMTSMLGMMKSLDGNGSIKITNGAIKGVDLKNMVKNIQSAFTSANKTSEQTEFSELGGTFTITQGIVINNDLDLKSQALTMSGKGKVNLPAQTIQYRLNPEMVSTLKRGDGSATKGLEFPIIIEGSLDNPHFIPDVEGIVKSAIENPNALRNTVKSLKDQIKTGKPDIGQVQDLLKSFGQ